MKYPNVNIEGYLQGKRPSLLQRIRRDRVLLLFFAPCFIWMIVFCYTPMAGIVVAFQDYKISKGILGSEWVGLKFFEQFFTSSRSIKVLLNTMYLSFFKLGFGFFIPIIFALLLNEVRQRPYLKTIQTVSYMPHFLSWSIVVLISQQLLHPSGGILMNAASSILNTTPTNVFSMPEAVLPLAFLTEIWKETGWNSIIYLAALSSVSRELYEAGSLDGASIWQRMWHISLPGILPTISILLIFNTGGLLNSNFDQMWLIRNSANQSTAEVIDTYVYQRAIYDLRYSFGTAVGLFKSVINIVLLLTANFAVRRLGQESLF